MTQVHDVSGVIRELVSLYILNNSPLGLFQPPASTKSKSSLLQFLLLHNVYNVVSSVLDLAGLTIFIFFFQ